MKELPKKLNSSRSPFFYGIIFSLLCGYGSTLLADSTKVVVPTVDPKKHQRRVVTGIITSPSNQFISSVKPTDTIYSTSKISSPNCPAGAYKAVHGITYMVTAKWYNYQFTVHCGNWEGCGNPDDTPLNATKMSGQQTTEPASICSPRNVIDTNNPGSPPSCTDEDAIATRQCYWYVCGHNNGSWYVVYTYTPSTYGPGWAEQYYPHICVSHGWTSSGTAD